MLLFFKNDLLSHLNGKKKYPQQQQINAVSHINALDPSITTEKH